MIKRIGIDLDNTLVDFMAGAIPKMKEMFGLEIVDTKNINRIEEAFGLKVGVPNKWNKWGFGETEEDSRKLKEVRHRMYVEGRLFRDLPLIEEDSEGLIDSLVKQNFRVYFITARSPHPTIIEDTEYWLNKNFSFFDDVFFTDNKADLCKTLNVPIIIEDEAAQIVSCVEAGIHTIARAQDWNGNITFDNKIGSFFRVNSWKQIPAIVEELMEH